LKSDFVTPWVFDTISLERHLARVDLMTHFYLDSFEFSTILNEIHLSFQIFF